MDKKEIVVTLTTAELAALDEHATRDLRTPEEQAAFYVLGKLYHCSQGPFNREQGPPRPLK